MSTIDRFSRIFAPTLKETPAEATAASHRLLVRAGFIRQLGAGLYSYLPLGWRSMRKIEQILRHEMDLAGGQEVLLPALQPAELWRESGAGTRSARPCSGSAIAATRTIAWA